MKEMQTKQLMCWSGMAGTEHSATSGSNEVVVVIINPKVRTQPLIISYQIMMDIMEQTEGSFSKTDSFLHAYTPSHSLHRMTTDNRNEKINQNCKLNL